MQVFVVLYIHCKKNAEQYWGSKHYSATIMVAVLIHTPIPNSIIYNSFSLFDRMESKDW